MLIHKTIELKQAAIQASDSGTFKGYASVFGGVIEVEGTEHDAMVGEGKGRHTHLGGFLRKVVDLAQPVEQREIAVHV